MRDSCGNGNAQNLICTNMYVYIWYIICDIVLGFCKRSHMGKLCKEYMRYFCITSYNCMPIYNYVKMKYLIKIVFSNILSTQSYINSKLSSWKCLEDRKHYWEPSPFFFLSSSFENNQKSEKWKDQRVLKTKTKTETKHPALVLCCVF